MRNDSRGISNIFYELFECRDIGTQVGKNDDKREEETTLH